MGTKQRSSSKRVRILAAAIVVGVYVLVGGYYFIFVNADSLGGGPTIDVDNSIYSKSFEAGADVAVPIELRGYIISASSEPQELWVSLSHDTSRLTHTKTVCGSIFKCNSLPWTRTSNYEFTSGSAICLRVQPGMYTGTLLTAHYTARKHVDGFSEYFSYTVYLAPGNCDRPLETSGVPFLWHEGSCSYSGGALCDNGPDISGQTPGLINTDEKTSDQSNSNNNSSGSRKYTSSIVGHTSNPMSASSAQSTENPQPAVQPSAFYDGKQYQAGSDAQEILGSVSVAGRSIPGYWFAGIGVLLVTVISSLFAWRYWHQRSTPHKLASKQKKT